MRNLLLLSFFAVISTALFAQPAITIDTKLAGYFPFSNCRGIDASGNGAVAVVDTSSCVCGVAGEALRFKLGSDPSIIVGGDVNQTFNTGNFTISFYFKSSTSLPNPGATQMVMSKQDGCTNQKAFWVRYRLQGQTGSTSNIISAGISENDTLNAIVSAKLSNSRCWHHIVISREGPRFSLFVDGVLEDDQITPVRVDITNNNNFTINDPVCPLDDNFYGSLDELRIYDRAYQADEINKLLALNPDEIVNGDTIIYLGNSFDASLTNTCATTIIWSPANGVSDVNALNPEITPTEATTYTVRFQHADGCAAYDTIHVNVIDPDTLDCGSIFIPNAFTPGFSSGRNDVFGISNPFAIAEFISLEIFDRWGGRVFNGASQFETWDGNFGSTPCNPGIYLYRLRYNCQSSEKVLTGTVTLLR